MVTTINDRYRNNNLAAASLNSRTFTTGIDIPTFFFFFWLAEVLLS